MEGDKLIFSSHEKSTENKPYTEYSTVSEIIHFFLKNCVFRTSFIFYLIIIVLQTRFDVKLNYFVTMTPILMTISSAALNFFTMLRRKKKFVKRFNKLHVDVFRNRKFVSISWKDVNAGDIVKLKNGDITPADLVVLKTADGQQCSIDSYLIDGSSSFTPKSAAGFQDLMFDGSIPDLSVPLYNITRKSLGSTQISPQYLFSAEAEFNGTRVQLNNKNYIERYSTVHHSDYIVCGVVFTGKDCVSARNPLYTHDYMKLDRDVNLLHNFMIEMIVFFAFAMSIFAYLNFDQYNSCKFTPKVSKFTYFVHSFVNIMVLMLPLSPLEIYAFLDLILIFNSNLIRHAYRKTYIPNTRCLYDLSHSNSVIFSKSMLLEPKPCLKRIYLNGNKYGKDITVRELSIAIQKNLLESRKIMRQFYDPQLLLSDDTKMFLLHLSLCHSASLVGSPDTFQYVSRYADDVQLLRLSANTGCMLIGRTPENSFLLINGKTFCFTTKKIFHSSVKHPRTSIIVEDPDGKIILFSRGNYKLMQSIIDNSDDLQMNYETMYEEGLHVEVCSMKYLSQKQYKRFEEKIQEFGVENTDMVYSLIENMEMHSTYLALVGFEDQPREGILPFIARCKDAFDNIVLTSQTKGTSLLITATSLGILKTNPIIGTIKGSDIEDIDASISSLLENPAYDVICIHGESNVFLEKSKYCKKLAETLRNTKLIILQRCDSHQSTIFVHFMRNFMESTVIGVGHCVYDFGYMLPSNVSISVASHEIVHPCDISSDVITSNCDDLSRIVFVHTIWIRERLNSFFKFMITKNVTFCFIQYFYFHKYVCSIDPLFSSSLTGALLFFFSFLPVFVKCVVDEKYTAEDLLCYPRFYKISNCQINPLYLVFRVFYIPVMAGFIIHYDDYLFDDKEIYSYTLSLSFLVGCVGYAVGSTTKWNLIHLFMQFGSVCFFVAVFLIKSSSLETNAMQAVFTSWRRILFVFVSFFIIFTISLFCRIFCNSASMLYHVIPPENNLHAPDPDGAAVSVFDQVEMTDLESDL